MNDEKRIEVGLWSVEGHGETDLKDIGFVIVKAKTGIDWTSQAHGTMCHHPAVEGFAIPIRVPHQIVSELHGYVCPDAGLDVAVPVNEILSRLPGKLSLDIETIKAPDELFIGEAWIPVVIGDHAQKGDSPGWFMNPVWGPLSGMKAIFTYENCD